MASDQMTPVERMTAYNKGEPVDRLPCVPIVGNTAARVVGVKVSEFRGNGRLIARAQIAAYRRFRYDIIRIFTDLYTQAKPWGPVCTTRMTRPPIWLLPLLPAYLRLTGSNRQIRCGTETFPSTWTR